MATINCSMCEANPAIMLITNLDNGESFSPCQECYPTFILAVAEGLMAAGAIALPELPDDEAAQASDQGVSERPATPDAETASTSPSKASGTTSGTNGRAAPKRRTASKSGANGPTSAPSVDQPTATVAQESDDPASEPATVAAN